MAIATKCLTPGANYTTDIGQNQVSVKVELPFQIELSESEAEQLERHLHNAVELVVAQLFRVNKS